MAMSDLRAQAGIPETPVVYIAFGIGEDVTPLGNPWGFGVEPLGIARFWPLGRPHGSSFLGFGFDGDDNALFLSVPHWFLILVFFFVLFFVWRKTCPKINPKMAFPVEIGAKHD